MNSGRLQHREESLARLREGLQLLVRRGDVCRRVGPTATALGVRLPIREVAGPQVFTRGTKTWHCKRSTHSESCLSLVFREFADGWHHECPTHLASSDHPLHPPAPRQSSNHGIRQLRSRGARVGASVMPTALTLPNRPAPSGTFPSKAPGTLVLRRNMTMRSMDTGFQHASSNSPCQSGSLWRAHAR